MSKHTPGPWEFHPASNYCGHAIAPLGTLPTLCAVERPAGSGSMCNITAHNFPGSTEANARLIAAAPDLLEASTALVERWDTPSWKEAAHTGEFIAALRAAIAKATGTGQ